MGSTPKLLMLISMLSTVETKCKQSRLNASEFLAPKSVELGQIGDSSETELGACVFG